jgi:hypothetical protein
MAAAPAAAAVAVGAAVAATADAAVAAVRVAADAATTADRSITLSPATPSILYRSRREQQH